MRSQEVSVDIIEHLRLHNSQSTDLELILEPEGQNFIIPSGVSLKIEAHGVKEGCLEVEVRNDSLICIYGWKNSVYYEDIEIYPHNKHPDWPINKNS